MVKRVTYPHSQEKNRRTTLPEEVQRAAVNLGHSVAAGTVTDDEIRAYRDALSELSCDLGRQGMNEIRNIALNYSIRPIRRPPTLFARPLTTIGVRATAPRPRKVSTPELGWLLALSWNGFDRQAALETIHSAPRCPFEVAILVYRLNDWVPNVRAAAFTTAERHLAQTPADAMAESAFHILPKLEKFERIEPRAKDLVFGLYFRAEVLGSLKQTLITRRTGEVAPTLRRLLRRADFDGALEELALGSKHPSVRALAAETLLFQRARWFTGYSRVWINKPLGVSRRVAQYASRDIAVAYDFDRLLAAAASDKSFLVRRIVADLLISKRGALTPAMTENLAALRTDKNGAIRARIRFLDADRSPA